MSIASKEDKWNTGSFLSSCGEDRHVDNQFKETEAQLGGIISEKRPVRYYSVVRVTRIATKFKYF